jgi:hypothetical protein
MSQFTESFQSTLSANNRNHLCISTDFSNTIWNTPGYHHLFNVSGLVRIRFWAICKVTLVDPVCQMELSVTAVNSVNLGVFDFLYGLFCDGEAYEAGPTIKAGDILIANSYNQNKASYLETSNGNNVPVFGVIKDVVLQDNIYVRLHNSDTPLTNGSIDFHIIWDAMEDGAFVTLGNGALEAQ